MGRTIFSLSAIAIFAKMFGFAEKLIIAHFFGTQDTADVYFASMGIVLSIVFLAKELIYPSLLPVFTESLSKPLHISAGLFKTAFLTMAGFLAVVVIVQAGFSDIFANILVPGFSESKKQLTSNMLRLLAPAVLLLSLSTVTYTVLNARKRFLKAACPEAALKLFIVAGLIALLPHFGINALAVVLGLGAIGALAVQLYFIPECRFLLKPHNRQTSEYPKKVLLLMGPLFIGVIFSHISGLVDNILASTLPSGHLSYLGYSKKLIDAILLVGPVALVTVVYSQLAHLSYSTNTIEFRKLFIKASRLLIYIALPVTCLLLGLKQPLIKLLFERGQFGAESTLGTSRAFMVYTYGLVTFSLETLIVYTFFALSNTKTPVKIGILCVCLDIALAVLLLKPFGYLGISWAFVISKTIKVTLLFAKLNKRLKGLFSSDILIFLAKLIAATTTAWLVLKLPLRIETSHSLLSRTTLDIVLPTAGFVSTFILCSCLLKINELKEIICVLKYREMSTAQRRGGTRWQRKK